MNTKRNNRTSVCPQVEIIRGKRTLHKRIFRPSSRSIVFCFAAISCLLVAPVIMAQSATSPLDVTWDLGVTDTGTQPAAQPATAAGSYYFRINTKSSEVWRTRLNVTSGEANLYLRRGQIPVVGQAGVRSSEAEGSDGLGTRIHRVRTRRELVYPGGSDRVFEHLVIGDRSTLCSGFGESAIHRLKRRWQLHHRRTHTERRSNPANHAAGGSCVLQGHAAAECSRMGTLAERRKSINGC